MSGIARTGPGEESWSGARNVRIFEIEFAQNWKLLLDSCPYDLHGRTTGADTQSKGNCFTNVWLREAVYKRLARPGKKPGFKSTLRECK